MCHVIPGSLRSAYTINVFAVLKGIVVAKKQPTFTARSGNWLIALSKENTSVYNYMYHTAIRSMWVYICKASTHLHVHFYVACVAPIIFIRVCEYKTDSSVGIIYVSSCTYVLAQVVLVKKHSRDRVSSVCTMYFVVVR